MFFCKRFLFVLVISVIFVGVLFGDFAAGTGTEDDPFQITTHEHLNNVRNYLGSEHSDKHFKLMNDIDLTEEFLPGGTYYNYGQGWVPIGYFTNEFHGNIDGDGYEIKGLFMDRDADYLGFFGYARDASIQNLILKDVDINGNQFVGSLIGYARSSTIIANYSRGNVSGSSYYVGGLVGATVTNSYSIGNVSGTSNIGGFVGSLVSSSQISNSYSRGNVTRTSGSNTSFGAFCGHNDQCEIIKSYSTGYVNSNV